MEFKIDLKIFIFLIIFYFTKQIEIFSIIIFFSIRYETTKNEINASWFIYFI